MTSYKDFLVVCERLPCWLLPILYVVWIIETVCWHAVNLFTPRCKHKYFTYGDEYSRDQAGVSVTFTDLKCIRCSKRGVLRSRACGDDIQETQLWET